MSEMKPYIMAKVKGGWKFNDGEVSFILQNICVDIKGKGEEKDQYDMSDVIDNFKDYQESCNE